MAKPEKYNINELNTLQGVVNITTPNGKRLSFKSGREALEYLRKNTPKGYNIYDTTNYGTNIDKSQTAILNRNTEREIEKATEQEKLTAARLANRQQNQEVGKEILLNIPGVSDAYDIYQIGKDIYNKNYGNAALTASMMLMPFDKLFKPIGKGIKKLQNITDEEWDKLYNKAIKNNDLKEAQNLRDLHFKAKAPNTKITNVDNIPVHAYHGTGKHFTEFDTTGKYSSLDEGYWGKGAYFSPNKEVADIYANGEKTPIIYDTYLNIENPKHIIMENSDYYGKQIQDHDGVVATLPEDIIDPDFDMTEYVATKPNQIKLADAITYDDNGNIIPLSKRDNFTNSDIRYSWLLPTIGVGTGLSLMNNETSQYKTGGKLISKFRNSGKVRLYTNPFFNQNISPLDANLKEGIDYNLVTQEYYN